MLRKVAAAAVIGLLALSRVAEARTLVLRASGPSASQYPAGKMLSEPVKLRLASGDRLVLLDDQGTRELKGPTTVDDRAPRKATARRLPTWDDLVRQSMRSRAASVRGFGAATSGPGKLPMGGTSQMQRRATVQANVWQIDPQVAGDWCVVDPASLSLWRADPAGRQALSIAPAGGAEASVEWKAGQQVALWPAAVATADAAAYTVTTPDGAATRIVLHLVQPAQDLDGLARQLAWHGCYHQLGILLG